MVTHRELDGAAGQPRIRLLATDELTTGDEAAIRGLMADAFGDDEDERFDDADWEHALGGTHVVLDIDGRIVAHAAVVERELHVAGVPVRTGYVEAVATAPQRQGSGLGTSVMNRVGSIIEQSFELGALGTGSHHFYERLGWRTWRGPAFVRLPAGGEQRTPDEEGYILVLRTPTTPDAIPEALDAPISCDWRPGDVW
jgi:aminoglycoside 2'-N-acetyltransferase I